MKRSDYAEEAIVYWDDTATAVELFFRVLTQWSTGATGPTGLRYEALYPLMDRLGLSARAWDDLLHDIQIMESAALAEIHTKD